MGADSAAYCIVKDDQLQGCLSDKQIQQFCTGHSMDTELLVDSH